VSPPEALKCDCGYDFASRSMGPSLLREKRRSSRGERPSQTKAAYLIVSALLLFVASIIPGIADSVGPPFRLFGFGLWLSGSTTWASAKGWHWGWGLLGLTVIGALVIAFLPIRTHPASVGR
jgi:hypothetical protein